MKIGIKKLRKDILMEFLGRKKARVDDFDIEWSWGSTSMNSSFDDIPDVFKLTICGHIKKK